MIRINLLPIKAKRRVMDARKELLLIGAMFTLTAVMWGMRWFQLEVLLQEQRDEINQMQMEITNIERVVKKVDEVQKTCQHIEQKLAVIDRLYKQKTGPAKLMSDLADIFTRQRKIWLTSFDEKNGVLTMQGGAMEQENISDFQMALEQQSKYFSHVHLTIVAAAGDQQETYFTWTLRCQANYAAG